MVPIRQKHLQGHAASSVRDSKPPPLLTEPGLGLHLAEDRGQRGVARGWPTHVLFFMFASLALLSTHVAICLTPGYQLTQAKLPTILALCSACSFSKSSASHALLLCWVSRCLLMTHTWHVLGISWKSFPHTSLACLVPLSSSSSSKGPIQAHSGACPTSPSAPTLPAQQFSVTRLTASPAPRQHALLAFPIHLFSHRPLWSFSALHPHLLPLSLPASPLGLPRDPSPAAASALPRSGCTLGFGLNELY